MSVDGGGYGLWQVLVHSRSRLGLTKESRTEFDSEQIGLHPSAPLIFLLILDRVWEKRTNRIVFPTFQFL